MNKAHPNHINPDHDQRAIVETRGLLLFKLDSNGRLLSTNEPAELVGDPAPDIYGCLAEGRLQTWYGSHTTSEFKTLFEDAVGSTDITAEKVYMASQRLAVLMKCEVTVDSGPAFYFEDSTLESSSDTVLVTSENCDVVKPFSYIHRNLEPLAPCIVKVVDGKTVSVCRTVRRLGPYVECGVDTLPDFEGHGYGTAVVRDWCAAALQLGLVPLYSTQWGNKASRAVARKLHMEQYAVDMSIWLDRPA